jgi:uncharacterized protein
MILIAGGTGLVGQRLSALLTQKGYDVAHLTRSKNAKNPYKQYIWDIKNGNIEAAALENAEAVINLTGAGIADARWTAARKKEIIESRTKSNALLKKAFEQFGTPNTYLSASAIGFYGDRGAMVLDEESDPGQGDFLSQTCCEWEKSIQSVATTGVRTVIFRIGIVCALEGGALPQTMLPIKFGLGTYFGNGQQYYSWIHIEDVCQLFIAALENNTWQGIYNAVAPHPVSNKDFTKTLIAAMRKKALLVAAPAFIMRLILGEMSAIVLFSSNISAKKVEAMGFQFKYPRLKEGLENLCLS